MTDRDPARDLIDFARSVRECGVPVSVAQTVGFLDAAARVGPERYYWAGRATMTTSADQIPQYDAAFRAYWQRRRTGAQVMTNVPREVIEVVESSDGPGGAGSSSAVSTRASDVELLRQKDFLALDDAGRTAVGRAIQRLRIEPPVRTSRRTLPAHRGQLDLRRMARRSLRTGGVPIQRAWRRQAQSARRGMFMVDVSASMSQYSHPILLLAHATLRALPHWEAFCFSTRLTRVSRELRSAAPDDALSMVAARVAAWDDGTRLGDALEEYLAGHRNRGHVRGAICVICSDGLDVGDPAHLGFQMRRLSLLAHRVVWVNPVYDEPGYEPTAAGMKAALPHVDRFVGGHNLARVEELAELLATP